MSDRSLSRLRPEDYLVVYGSLILLGVGIVMFAVGLRRGDDALVIFGAVVTAFVVLLPRIKGRFKLGPGGIEGSLIDREEFLRLVEKAGEESGLPSHRVEDLVEDAREITAPLGAHSPRSKIPTSDLGYLLARRFVDDAGMLYNIVKYVLYQAGWKVETSVRVPSGFKKDTFFLADIVATQGGKKLVIEIKPTTDASNSAIAGWINHLNYLVETTSADGGVLVVADKRSNLTSSSSERVRVLSLAEFLKEFPFPGWGSVDDVE